MSVLLIMATGSCHRNTKAPTESHPAEVREGDQGGLQGVIDKESCFKMLPRASSYGAERVGSVGFV